MLRDTYFFSIMAQQESSRRLLCCSSNLQQAKLSHGLAPLAVEGVLARGSVADEAFVARWDKEPRGCFEAGWLSDAATRAGDSPDARSGGLTAEDDPGKCGGISAVIL